MIPIDETAHKGGELEYALYLLDKAEAELAHYKRALGLAAEDACYYARITLLAQNKFKRECKQDWLKRASDQED